MEKRLFVPQIFAIPSGFEGLPGSSVVENPSVKQEMWVWSLWEDALEREMATRSSILAQEILWTEETGELKSMGLQRVGHDLATQQQQ